MKKIILLLLLISTKSIAQDKTETQDWIRKQFYNYRYTNSVINEHLTFDNGYLYYKTNSAEFRVKIKDIQKVKIEKSKFNSNDDEGWAVLSFKFKTGKFEIRLSGEADFKMSDNESKIDFFLVSKFISDNMKPRMEKSIVHLVKLYGGDATIYKEPF